MIAIDGICMHLHLNDCKILVAKEEHVSETFIWVMVEAKGERDELWNALDFSVIYK